MLELRQLDLQLAFEAAGALREDVQNQSSAIEHSTLEQLLEIAFLAGRQGVVEHHQIRAELLDPSVNLFGFAAADIQPRIRHLASAGDDREHFGAGRTGQRLELTQLIFTGRTSQSDADQERAFAAARTFKQQRTPTVISLADSYRLRALFFARRQADGPRRNDCGNRVLVDHLADAVFQQDDELIERVDLTL